MRRTENKGRESSVTGTGPQIETLLIVCSISDDVKWLGWRSILRITYCITWMFGTKAPVWTNTRREKDRLSGKDDHLSSVLVMLELMSYSK